MNNSYKINDGCILHVASHSNPRWRNGEVRHEIGFEHFNIYEDQWEIVFAQDDLTADDFSKLAEVFFGIADSIRANS